MKVRTFALVLLSSIPVLVLGIMVGLHIADSNFPRMPMVVGYVMVFSAVPVTMALVCLEVQFSFSRNVRDKIRSN